MNETKSSKKRRKYDAEFKAEVLRMVANGQSAPQVAKALGISESLIYRWKSKQKHSYTVLTKGKKETPIVELQEENKQLKGKLRQTELERDILKKALSIFSQVT